MSEEYIEKKMHQLRELGKNHANAKKNLTKLEHGRKILLSVIIYYVHYFLGVLGKSEKIPISVSIWMPIILLTIISSIGLVRINEK